MKKQVIIESKAWITSGYTQEAVEIGQIITIVAKDENGQAVAATGNVIEIIEL